MTLDLFNAPTATEALAARGYTHRELTAFERATLGVRKLGARAIVRDGEIVAAIDAGEVWEWLRGQS